MAGEFWLNEAQRGGRTAASEEPNGGAQDDHRVISGIVHVPKIGCRGSIARRSTVRPRRSTIGSPPWTMRGFGADVWSARARWSLRWSSPRQHDGKGPPFGGGRKAFISFAW